MRYIVNQYATASTPRVSLDEASGFNRCGYGASVLDSENPTSSSSALAVTLSAAEDLASFYANLSGDIRLDGG